MILDDLFSTAATDYAAGKSNISVQAGVTTNQTGGLSSNTNNGSAYAVALQYEPRTTKQTRFRILVVPAAFYNENSAITITEPLTLQLNGHYEVGILGTTFTPTVDANTQIVNGAAGAVCVTISLCGYSAASPDPCADVLQRLDQLIILAGGVPVKEVPGWRSQLFSCWQQHKITDGEYKAALNEIQTHTLP